MKILLEKNCMNLMTQKVIFSVKKNSLLRNRVNFLGQNIFFSGRKEWTYFVPESVSSPQKAADSILNRRERLQKIRTALGHLETVLQKEIFVFLQRREKKAKQR
jgi:hypothetical protein